MLCYLDMTFCAAFGEKCSNSDCRRAITPEVRDSARRWWGGDDAPLAVSDLSHSCSIRIPITET